MNHPSLLRVLVRGLAVAAVSVAAGAVVHAAGGEPVVPAAIRAPAGASLVARFHATGAQVYECAAAAGRYAWTLKRPDATLVDGAGAPVGTHTAGPTWTMTKDGSSVKAEKLAQADAPVAGAVPWLLLRATSTAGHGSFSQVTYVQRIGTQGGQAPAAGCDAQAAGKETRASYSADYVFYTGGATKPAASAPDRKKP
ncbi:MAG TPA: DUF3455 domain-containing protein [Polyangia bacterium]|nr:DUF3455 domain-containing protein [Polyangia bacterium]